MYECVAIGGKKGTISFWSYKKALRTQFSSKLPERSFTWHLILEVSMTICFMKTLFVMVHPFFLFASHQDKINQRKTFRFKCHIKIKYVSFEVLHGKEIVLYTRCILKKLVNIQPILLLVTRTTINYTGQINWILL